MAIPSVMDFKLEKKQKFVLLFLSPIYYIRRPG
jgi:hypothetical protein